MKRFFLLAAMLPMLATAALAQTNPFPFAIFEKMQQQSNTNILVSPFSIEQAVGMVTNAAQGTCLTELLALTNNPSTAAMNKRNQDLRELLTRYEEDTLCHMNVANSVWYKPGLSLLQPFCDSVRLHYNAHIDTANFATQQGIDSVNQWVSDNTHHLINEIYKSPMPDMQVSLINTVLFGGRWPWYCHVGYDTDKAFRNADGSGTMVKTLSIWPVDQQMPLLLSNDFVAVRLHFKAEDSSSPNSLYLIMPRDPEHVQPLTAQAWNELLTNEQKSYVRISAPEFDLQQSENILPTLQEMGTLVNQDFSGLTGAALPIDKITHIVRMKMNDKGMEAAAVTAIDMPTGQPDYHEPLDINIDRPFYVAITAEGAEEPIFLGRINSLAGSACAAPTPVIFNLPDALDDLDATLPLQKIIRNGQVLILRNGRTYDLTGRITE